MIESSAAIVRKPIKTIGLWLEFLPPILPILGAILYLDAVVGLSSSSSMVFCLASLLGVLSVGAVGWRSRLEDRRQIEHALSQVSSDSDAKVDSGKRNHVLGTLGRWPQEMMKQRLVGTFLCMAPVPILFRWLGVAGAIEAPVLGSFLLVTMIVSSMAAGIQYLASRLLLRPVLTELAQHVDEGEAGPRSATGFSLSSVLAFSIVLPAAFATLLALDLSSHQARRASEADVLRWCEVAIDSVLRARDEGVLDQWIAEQQVAQSSWPYPVRLLGFSEGELGLGAADTLSPGFMESLGHALDAHKVSGRVRPVAGAEVGSFVRLTSGAVVVATVARKDFMDSAAVGSGVALLFLLGSLAVLLFWASLVGRDVRQGLSGLRQFAQSLAAGDLRNTSFPESQAELADIGVVIERTRGDLRRAVLRTREALGRAAEIAGSTQTGFGRMAGEGGQQIQRLARVNKVIGQVGEKVQQLCTSAEALSESVDESSSSVAELGAASGELNQTASVLSSQVDEVSGSMEHMVQSVKQVGEVTDRLAGASEDTSSSMEEMASAMRMIDTSAESMAVLSRDVVEKAELGQEKVSQTIVGMEAIRDATEVAERVIRGLGARTSEIGGILDVIEDVADETNLLALNAAIIAAQAGEQGKAFSVVADQIKELADRVLASTKEIDGLIRAVQDESENAIGAIAAGSESVMSGVDLSVEAGRTLEEITDASRETGSRIAEIVLSVREQTTAAGHVVSLMERVRDSADEIHAASDEQRHGNEVIYRSALTMREVAQQVHRTTDEQAGGFGRIRESIEGGRTTIEVIQAALGEQAEACGEVSAFLEEAFEGTRVQQEVADSLGSSTQGLVETIQALREEVERFQVQ